MEEEQEMRNGEEEEVERRRGVTSDGKRKRERERDESYQNQESTKFSSGGASTSPISTNDEKDTKMSPASKINLSETMVDCRDWRETKRGKRRGKHRKTGDGKCKFERERKGKGNRRLRKEDLHS
ncbi:hypothetical protein TIFTF001_031423 [Ficus carica]|uniref:Uncharacterized protein n=1 Tax=Ficus carica TaxID=3494 RepID=A0AA88DWE2_FICCA|nr:hypothetical protein TIFTF001_031423 [Ficus carica]